MKIEKKWAMPNKNTFSIKPIKELIERYNNGEKGFLSIDPFANNSKVARVTNDLNKKYDTDYHLDAIDFLRTFEDNSIDLVLFDPPYSLRQLKESYNGIGRSLTQKDTQSFWTDVKREIAKKVKKGGIVISFGWNSNGLGKVNGFSQEEILLVAHGGNHNDTIIVVEMKK